MSTDGHLRQVRQWCEQARVEGFHGELSDDAAVLIAAGRLDEQTRTILANRRRAGRGVPSIGGFGNLRRLSDEYARTNERVAQLGPGPVQSLMRLRVATLGKRLQAMRATVELAPGHYAGGIRSIRRDRRGGVHLKPRQRRYLFAALQHTPAPTRPRPVDQAREATVRLVQRTPLATVASALGPALGADENRFVDRFDTLLFVAGVLYDRIDGSSVWHSDHFMIQRAQLDLADELVQISVDTTALRDIVTELDDAYDDAVLESARVRIRSRRQALTSVWDQLLERVAALARIADLLTTAEAQLQSMAALHRTDSLDSRIDELIARSGNRELSAANTHFVGDQIVDVDELLSSYRAALYDDIAVLTSRS